jgi:hypothetical protein
LYVAEPSFAKANGRLGKMQDSSPKSSSEQGSASTKSGSSERRDGPKLKTQLQTACRRKGYALSTKRTYWR